MRAGICLRASERSERSEFFRISPSPVNRVCHIRRCRGGGATPPWLFQTMRRRASRKGPADGTRRLLAIDGIIVGPRSIFDPVMAGQMSSFRKFHDFLGSRVHISKIIIIIIKLPGLLFTKVYVHTYMVTSEQAQRAERVLSYLKERCHLFDT